MQPRHPSTDAADLGRDQAGEQNWLLRALPAASYERLWPHLEAIDAPAKQGLWKSGAPLRSVYFPRTCVVSLVVPVAQEAGVEAATVGREGFAGVPIVLGADSTSSDAMVQVAGALV